MLIAKININKIDVDKIVCFETFIGSTVYNKALKIFVRITIMYTENAAIFKNT
jgi:hypothetical protein